MRNLYRGKATAESVAKTISKLRENIDRLEEKKERLQSLLKIKEEQLLLMDCVFRIAEKGFYSYMQHLKDGEWVIEKRLPFYEEPRYISEEEHDRVMDRAMMTNP